MGSTFGGTRPKYVSITITAVCAVLLATLFGAEPASTQHLPPGLLPEGDWTQPQIDWLVDWIHRTETILPRHFPTTYTGRGSALVAKGYTSVGAIDPGGYRHWTKVSSIFDSHFLDPAYPETLLYQRNARGGWALRAAVFMLPVGVERGEIPPLLSWIPGWHGHSELCTWTDGRRAAITDPGDPNCPAGSYQASTPLMTHVWLTDPGCGHRFAGVAWTGLECEMHDMHHMNDMPDHDMSGHDMGM